MKTKKTKTAQVLDFIKSGKTKGKTFSEIQRFIVEDLHGYDYDEMSEKYDWKSDSYKPARRYRGYWCAYLYGGFEYSRTGLFKTYCTKINGHWVHNDYVK